MSKEDVIKIKGQVIDVLPNSLFKIKLENAHEILGHISGKMRKNNIYIVLNDRVDVEMSPYDMDKGRIVFRHKS